MDPVEIYHTFINYGKGPREKLDCQELYEKLENKIEKSKLDKLIFTLDSMDNSKDGYIDFKYTSKHGELIFYLVLDKCFGIPKEEGYVDAKFSDRDIIRIFGGDFKKELELTAIALQEIDAEKDNKKFEEIQAKFSEIPPEILKKLPIGDGTKITKLESGYKTEEAENITTYYNENGDYIKTEIFYPNGLKETNTADNEVIAEFGKTEGKYFPVVPMLKNVSVNKGLPNQTDFEILYNDDGEAIDIKLDSDTCIKIDNVNKNLLLNMINNEEEFGRGYDIQVDGYSIIVSELEKQ